MDENRTSTIAERLECAQRELRMRKDVYPRLVQRGKMKPGQAYREFAVMTDIVKDYQEAVERDPQGAGRLL